MKKRNKGRGGKRIPVARRVVRIGLMVAACLAVKAFLFDLRRIPTPSMQPTLMGDAEAGIHNLLLVDKLTYRLREPRRFEVIAFAWPLDRRRSYVKRIWGLPGEWLRVKGGDVWLGDGGPRGETILRKPLTLQEHLWLTVFDSTHLPGYLEKAFLPACGEISLAEAGEGVVVTTGAGGGVLRYRQSIKDSISHGYPRRAAALIRHSFARGRESTPGSFDFAVPDLEAEMTLTAGKEGGTLILEIEENGTHRAEVPLGRGRTRLLTEGKCLATRRGPGLAPGRPQRLSFANCDDRLVLHLEGRPPLVRAYASPGGGCRRSSFRLGLREAGRLVLSRFRLCRDIHYTDMSKAAATRRATGVWLHGGPRDYLVLGDNPRRSADSREWFLLRLRDPATGATLCGACEPHTLTHPPGLVGPDRNPSLDPGRRRVRFTDCAGRAHILAPPLAGEGGLWLEQAAAWLREGELEGCCGVSRRLILGRALAVLWPWHAPSRPGWVH